MKFKKIYKEVIHSPISPKLVVVGEKMSEFVWYWTKGNSKVYTKNTEVAEKAMKEGKFVLGMKIKPNIIKY